MIRNTVLVFFLMFMAVNHSNYAIAQDDSPKSKVEIADIGAAHVIQCLLDHRPARDLGERLPGEAGGRPSGGYHREHFTWAGRHAPPPSAS